jgi:hypothetical protein
MAAYLKVIELDGKKYVVEVIKPEREKTRTLSTHSK